MRETLAAAVEQAGYYVPADTQSPVARQPASPPTSNCKAIPSQPTAHDADVVIVGDDLRAAPRTILLARATSRTIKQNLAWAFLYIVL